MILSFTCLRRGASVLLAVALSSLFALVLATWGNSASATPYPPSAGCTISTTTANAGPGDTVTLVGSGFPANQSVALSVPSASAALGSVTTTSTGTFSTTFTWPASVNGSSALVEASAPSTTCSFSLVNHHGVESTTSHRSSGGGSTGSGGLSSTGFATLTATTIAVALIGAGAMFLGLARRKRV